MSLKDDDSNAHGAAPAESPGRLIAKAREAMSIGAVDLATRLRLDTRIVQALERDDFENLPAPMFVKGYIRSIAKELDLDADTVLRAYETQTSVEPPSLADFSSRAPEQVGINSTVIKIVTYGLVTLLVILIALWWRANYPESDTVPPASPDASTATSATPLPYAFEVVEHDNDSWRIAPPPETTLMPAPEAPTTDDAESVASATSPGTGHSLTVATSDEAWVEIYDADGERLYFGMARSDRTIELSEQEYYRLTLGNSESITLTYDGDVVDLAPHSAQGVAQLELGATTQSGNANP